MNKKVQHPTHYHFLPGNTGSINIPIPGHTHGMPSYDNIKRSVNEILYMSHFVLSLLRNENKRTVFHSIKNRNDGIIGEIELDKAIDLISSMLSYYKFDGSNKLFQQNIKERLIEVISDVMKGNDCIPQNTVKKDINGGITIDGS